MFCEPSARPRIQGLQRKERKMANPMIIFRALGQIADARSRPLDKEGAERELRHAILAGRPLPVRRWWNLWGLLW